MRVIVKNNNRNESLADGVTLLTLSGPQSEAEKSILYDIAQEAADGTLLSWSHIMYGAKNDLLTKADHACLNRIVARSIKHREKKGGES
jgi:hypothetical protein